MPPLWRQNGARTKPRRPVPLPLPPLKHFAVLLLTFAPPFSGQLRRASLAFLFFFACAASGQVELWLTDPSGTARFEPQSDRLEFVDTATTGTTIKIDEKKRFQQI